MDATQVSRLAAKTRENIEKVLVGQSENIKLVICAILAGGHALLEDVPGTGKTMLARSLAMSLEADFSRVQCTPDLLPGDITGQLVYRPKTGEFEFEKGPLFSNVVLADEINRATPRSQSALLECMQENQVTISGVTHALPDPFFVIATQNPVEMTGTFPLPEAQLDRFLICISMGYPNAQDSVNMIRRFSSENPLFALTPVAGRAELQAARAAVPRAHVSDAVAGYIAALCEKTRSFEGVLLGASPRAALALMRAAQAWALLSERDYVTPEDVKAVAVPALAHRLVLSSSIGNLGKAREIMRQILGSLPVPTES